MGLGSLASSYRTRLSQHVQATVCVHCGMGKPDLPTAHVACGSTSAGGLLYMHTRDACMMLAIISVCCKHPIGTCRAHCCMLSGHMQVLQLLAGAAPEAGMETAATMQQGLAHVLAAVAARPGQQRGTVGQVHSRPQDHLLQCRVCQQHAAAATALPCAAQPSPQQCQHRLRLCCQHLTCASWIRIWHTQCNW